MRRDIYLVCCTLAFNSQVALASEDSALKLIKDNWWAVFLVPGAVLLKKFLQGLDDHNSQ